MITQDTFNEANRLLTDRFAAAGGSEADEEAANRALGSGLDLVQEPLLVESMRLWARAFGIEDPDNVTDEEFMEAIPILEAIGSGIVLGIQAAKVDSE